MNSHRLEDEKSFLGHYYAHFTKSGTLGSQNREDRAMVQSVFDGPCERQALGTVLQPGSEISRSATWRVVQKQLHAKECAKKAKKIHGDHQSESRFHLRRATKKRKLNDSH